MIKSIICKLKPYQDVIIVLSLFITALIIRSIKADFFVPSTLDETDATERISTYLDAVRWYKWHPMPVGHLTLNTFFKFISHGSIYWQRFPVLVAGALSVPVFYCATIRWFENRKFALLLSLVPLFNFLLIFYAQEVRSYAIAWTLILAGLYTGYAVIARGINSRPLILGFFISIALLPITHYIGWLHIVILDLALLVYVLTFSGDKVQRLLKLLAANTIVAISSIAWADSFYYRVLRTLFIDPQGNLGGEKPYRFTTELFFNTLNKVVGGYPLFVKLLVLFVIGSIIWLVIKTIRQRLKIGPLDHWTWFISFYFLFFILIMAVSKSAEMLIPRHYYFIIWPFLFLFGYGAYELWQSKQVLARIIAGLLIGLLIAINFSDSVLYLSAQHRFNINLRAVAEFVEKEYENKNKTKLYLEVGKYDYISPLFKNSKLIDPESVVSAEPYIYHVAEPSIVDDTIKKLQNTIDCCAKETVFVFPTYSKERSFPPANFRNLELIRYIKGDKGLDYLEKIDASPFGKGMEHENPKGYPTIMIAH